MLYNRLIRSLLVVSALSTTNAVKKESKRTFKIIPSFKPAQSRLVQLIEKNEILTDYLYHFKPAGALDVTYHYKGEIYVNYGNYLSPMDTIDAPTFTFESFFSMDVDFEERYYTVAMTDLDLNYEKCHAIWTNLKIDKDNVEIVYLKDQGTGSTSAILSEADSSFKYNFDLEDGTSLVPYVGPRPRNGTGIHRYVFMLFRQPEGRLTYEPLLYRDRWGSKSKDHGIQDWADYYSLQPLAINFFRSSNEGLF